tara:strand:- start:19 stop:603 length:585 start_codon:yes stop_codon:yes gene_type:complete
MPTNYENGKIYKIVSPNTKLVYYGSTVQELTDRFSYHKTDKSQCTSKKIIVFGGAIIELIKNFSCSCVEDLEDVEACYILDDWEGCVNEHVPGAIRRAGGIQAYDKQYRKDNAVKIAERMKQYKKENAVKISEQMKQKIECEKCGSFISRRNISTHKKTSKKCLKAFETQQNAKTIINIQHVEHLTVNKLAGVL